MRILKIMVFLTVFLSILSVKPTLAASPTRTIYQYSPRELVAYFAQEYNSSVSEMDATITCESNWDPKSTGDHNLANGISQFHQATFNSWSKEMGETLNYNSTFDQIKVMAWAYAQGESFKENWSCYTMIYKTHKRPLIS